MHAEPELPTLRLATLRRLLARKPAPLVFDRDTPLAIIEEALAELPFAKVVLVDRDGALCGLLSASDLPLIRDHHLPAATAMATHVVVLEPEYDVESALAALEVQHADHVVVALAGSLIGVLSRADLERSQARSGRAA
jgi:CBS domain-containing protein